MMGVKLGAARAARIATIETTTINSITVNPRCVLNSAFDCGVRSMCPPRIVGFGGSRRVDAGALPAPDAPDFAQNEVFTVSADRDTWQKAPFDRPAVASELTEGVVDYSGGS